jgi:phosphoserine phosphatase
VASHIATLVAAPGSEPLDSDKVNSAVSLLGGASTGWLDPGMAADISFDGPIGETGPNWPALHNIADRLRDIFSEERVDVFVQLAAHRRKKLFLADMDSTMIGQECIDELADFVGKKAHVAEITERAMRGEIAFEPALRERVALLKGLEESVVDKVIAERITLTPGGATLVKTMRANGAYTALVSGGFTLFTRRIGAMIGFQENRANLLIVEGGKFAGLVEEPILGREAKLATLVELRALHRLLPQETMATGDGANDLAMLEEAGLGVAFHAKPAVAAAAHARIDHGDLSVLLFAQGYRRSEFVEP